MRPESELRECLSCSCFAVRRAARMITQHYDRHLKPTGLRATQLSLLTVLALSGPLPLSRVADLLGMERTTLTRNLRLLVSRGLIQELEAKDRRVRRLGITSKGLVSARSAIPRWREAQRSLADRLGASAIRGLSVATEAAAEMSVTRPNRTTSRKKEA